MVIGASVLKQVKAARAIVAESEDLSINPIAHPAASLWSDPERSYRHKVATFHAFLALATQGLRHVGQDDAGPEPESVAEERAAGGAGSRSRRVANSVPWIGDEEAGEDYWAGYAHERAEPAGFLVDHGIRNVCMLSADAHMVAIDDGTNSGYAAGRRGGFPVFQAAALESPASEKGGPYSIGDPDGGAGFWRCRTPSVRRV